MPSNYESINVLAHWRSQSPYDSISSQKPTSWHPSLKYMSSPEIFLGSNHNKILNLRSCKYYLIWKKKKSLFKGRSS
jgi:hypothetical protein